MSRRRAAQRREVLPDPKFGDTVLTRVMNCLMYSGKKSVAETIVYGALDTIGKKTGQDALKIFHGALDKGDAATLDKLIDVFFRPYVELRRSHPGYAVSLVKALTVKSGHAVGGVRAPLTEPDPAHVEAAWTMVQQAREALA